MEKNLTSLKPDTPAGDGTADPEKDDQLTRKDFNDAFKMIIRNVYPRTDSNIEKMTKNLENEFVSGCESGAKLEALKMYAKLCKLILKAKVKIPQNTASID